MAFEISREEIVMGNESFDEHESNGSSSECRYFDKLKNDSSWTTTPNTIYLAERIKVRNNTVRADHSKSTKRWKFDLFDLNAFSSETMLWSLILKNSIYHI